MTFLHPILAAAGAACVSVPILIHILMRRRRRPIAWGAMRFLREAYRKQKKKVALEQWLLLTARCLLVLLAALAIGGLARGGSGSAATERPTVLYILIDNSLTAAAGAPTSLERHAAAARGLLQELSGVRGDRVGVVALARPAEAVLLPATIGVVQAMQALQAVTVCDSGADLAGALSLVGAQQHEPHERIVVAVLSDWLAGSIAEDLTLPELPAGWELIAATPAAEGLRNVRVQSVEPVRRVMVASGVLGGDETAVSGTEQVYVEAKRFGTGLSEQASAHVRVRIERQGESQLLGEAVLRFAPGVADASAPVNVNMGAIGAGGALLVAQVEPDMLARDDSARHPIEIRGSLKVGLVAALGLDRPTSLAEYAPADWLRLALSPEPDAAGEHEVELTMIDPGSVDGPRLAGLDAVIVADPEGVSAQGWARLRTFVEAGGLLVVYPQAAEGAQAWIDAFVEGLGVEWTIGREPQDVEASVQPSIGGEWKGLLSLLEGEMPELAPPVRVSRRLAVDGAGPAAVSLTDGSPLVVAGRSAAGTRGLVVLFTAPMDPTWTTLPAKPLMLPLTQELVRQGIGIAKGAWVSVAGDRVAAPAGTVELVPLDGRGAAIRMGADGRTESPVRVAGAWRATGQGGRVVGTVVVSPDAHASNTMATQPAEVVAWLERSGVKPRFVGAQGDDGEGAALAAHVPAQPLGFELLLGAAVVAVMEVWLARRASHVREAAA